MNVYLFLDYNVFVNNRGKDISMRKILIIFICAMFMMPLRADAFSWKEFFAWLFSTPQVTAVDTTKLYEDTTTKISNIKLQANAIDPSVKTALVAVASAVSTENELENLKTKLNAKDADILSVLTDYQKTLNNNKARILVTLKTMSDKDKTAFEKDVNSLSSLGQKYSDLASEVWTLKNTFSSSAPSGTDKTAKLKELTDLYSAVSGKASTVSGFANLMKIYAKLTGLNI